MRVYVATTPEQIRELLQAAVIFEDYLTPDQFEFDGGVDEVVADLLDDRLAAGIEPDAGGGERRPIARRHAEHADIEIARAFEHRQRCPDVVMLQTLHWHVVSPAPLARPAYGAFRVPGSRSVPVIAGRCGANMHSL